MKIEGISEGYNRQGGQSPGYFNPLRIKKKPIYTVVFDDVDLSGAILSGSEQEWLLSYIIAMPTDVVKDRLKKFAESFSAADDCLIYKLLMEAL